MGFQCFFSFFFFLSGMVCARSAMINGNWKAGFLWDGRHKSNPEQGCSTGLYDMYNTNLFFTFRGTLSRGTRFSAIGNPCNPQHAPTREIRTRFRFHLTGESQGCRPLGSPVWGKKRWYEVVLPHQAARLLNYTQYGKVGRPGVVAFRGSGFRLRVPCLAVIGLLGNRATGVPDMGRGRSGTSTACTGPPTAESSRGDELTG
jgi:hypothetical protein